MCQVTTCSKLCDLFYPTADVIAQGHGGPECKKNPVKLAQNFFEDL